MPSNKIKYLWVGECRKGMMCIETYSPSPWETISIALDNSSLLLHLHKHLLPLRAVVKQHLDCLGLRLRRGGRHHVRIGSAGRQGATEHDDETDEEQEERKQHLEPVEEVHQRGERVLERRARAREDVVVEALADEEVAEDGGAEELLLQGRLGGVCRRRIGVCGGVNDTGLERCGGGCGCGASDAAADVADEEGEGGEDGEEGGGGEAAADGVGEPDEGGCDGGGGGVVHLYEDGREECEEEEE
ncbi:hypothetical protein C8R46DRAFT_373531 [Mycena filopes]|nr:hypothetical protein C8R46DRAFT_373531 [Mycena filopes]